jgi:hypothetical protein
MITKEQGKTPERRVRRLALHPFFLCVLRVLRGYKFFRGYKSLGERPEARFSANLKPLSRQMNSGKLQENFVWRRLPAFR